MDLVLCVLAGLGLAVFVPLLFALTFLLVFALRKVALECLDKRAGVAVQRRDELLQRMFLDNCTTVANFFQEEEPDIAEVLRQVGAGEKNGRQIWEGFKQNRQARIRQEHAVQDAYLLETC